MLEVMFTTSMRLVGKVFLPATTIEAIFTTESKRAIAIPTRSVRLKGNILLLAKNCCSFEYKEDVPTLISNSLWYRVYVFTA